MLAIPTIYYIVFYSYIILIYQQRIRLLSMYKSNEMNITCNLELIPNVYRYITVILKVYEATCLKYKNCR